MRRESATDPTFETDPVKHDVTVVICAHDANRWQRLRDAVASLHRQSIPPREIVVVIDHNPELATEARSSLNGARVLESRRERGLCGARNSGLEAASGSIVAFMDDDATASEQWLELLVAEYSDDVAGVGGATFPVWESGRPDWFPPEFDWVVGGPYRGMQLVRQDVRNLWGGNMSFRRELVAAVGGFRIGYSCDDTELCIRLRQRWPGQRFVFVPEARVFHHIDAARTTVARFVARCYFEGGSKAVISRLVGAGDALQSERHYARRVVPAGVGRSLRELVRDRDPSGALRAGLIVVGIGSATTGYAVGLLTPDRSARKRGWRGERISRHRRAQGRTSVEAST